MNYLSTRRQIEGALPTVAELVRLKSVHQGREGLRRLLMVGAGRLVYPGGLGAGVPEFQPSVVGLDLATGQIHGRAPGKLQSRRQRLVRRVVPRGRLQ